MPGVLTFEKSCTKLISLRRQSPNIMRKLTAPVTASYVILLLWAIGSSRSPMFCSKFLKENMLKNCTDTFPPVQTGTEKAKEWSSVLCLVIYFFINYVTSFRKMIRGNYCCQPENGIIHHTLKKIISLGFHKTRWISFVGLRFWRAWVTNISSGVSGDAQKTP